MATTTRYKIRADTTANWASVNPILLKGEMGFDTDANKLKVGDGLSTWSNLAYLAGGIDDAASDGKAYGRQNGAWVEV